MAALSLRSAIGEDRKTFSNGQAVAKLFRCPLTEPRQFDMLDPTLAGGDGMQFDQLKRRDFITLLGGAAVGWPLAARAQQPAPIRPLIGVLSPLSAAAARPLITAFRSALRDLGYVDGRNATLALRFGDGALERNYTTRIARDRDTNSTSRCCGRRSRTMTTNA